MASLRGVAFGASYVVPVGARLDCLVAELRLLEVEVLDRIVVVFFEALRYVLLALA